MVRFSSKDLSPELRKRINAVINIEPVVKKVATDAIRLEVKPLSVNAAYRGRRFRSSEYQDFKKQMEMALKQNPIKIPNSKYLKIFFDFGLSNNAADWDGPIKTAQDCLFEHIGLNDKVIRAGEVVTTMVDVGNEYIWVRLEPYTPTDLRLAKVK